MSLYRVVVYNISYMFDAHVHIELHTGHTLDDAVNYFLETGPPGNTVDFPRSYMALIDYEVPAYNGKAMEPMPLAVWNCYTLEHWVGEGIPKRFRNIRLV